MNQRGKNILPMIGFIILIGLVLGGFVMAREIKGDTELVQESDIRKTSKGDTIDETGEVSTNQLDKISIRSVSSDIKVYTHDSEQVKAHFYGKFITTNKNATPYLEVVRSEKTASVRIVYPVTPAFSVSEHTKLDIHIPEKWAGDLEISNVSGRISADSLSGDDIMLQTTSGNLEIDKMISKGTLNTKSVSGKSTFKQIESKDAKLHSTSGNIKAESIMSSEINAGTVSGRMEIWMKAESVVLESVSGEINAVLNDAFNTFMAKNISGRVKLAIPEDSEFDVHVKTVTGNIRCKDFPVKISSSKDNELKGQVGSGDSQININTTSGSVEIYK